MDNFDEFREGWWNCFISFADINEFYADSNDMPIMEVLEGAGVSIEEIDAVLNDTSFQLSERLVRYLNYYKNKKLKQHVSNH
jgi:hypothetical protein